MEKPWHSIILVARGGAPRVYKLHERDINEIIKSYCTHLANEKIDVCNQACQQHIEGGVVIEDIQKTKDCLNIVLYKQLVPIVTT